MERSSAEKFTDATPAALRHLCRQMAAYSRAAGAIVQGDDLASVCARFLEAIREHSGYRRAVLTLLDAGGNDYQWFFAGFTDADIDFFHAHRLRPAEREALLQDRNRIGSSYRLPAAGGGAGGLRRNDRDAPGSDPLLVPLRGAGGGLVGTLMLDRPAGDTLPPSEESLSALELFAAQAAHAIEKKRLDQMVKSAQARLRTAQEQLMQAEKMSAIGQLISGVTHELNNPLAGIMGFAQLLLNAGPDPKARRSLERIHGEAVRCQKIVQNLLGFSRRHKPEKTYHGLSEVIDAVLELRAYQLQVDNVEVARRYDADAPRTMLDFHQMQQVVLNLVNNAHQAMMETAGRPRRLVVTTGRDGGVLRARFADTGPGIPRERLEKIFDAFFTTKEIGKGTGLGLSLARSILKDHQGTIAVESVLGEGTTFTIEVPLVEEERPQASETAGAPAGGAARSLRVLVVDDEPILVELLSDFLKSTGHAVDRAHNGREALDLASARDYDIILSDLKMPGLDGQALYGRLCEVKPGMATRFVFFTGDLINPRVQTFFQSTGCLYLTKPFSLESVLAAFDKLQRKLQAA